jgi:hypothetical protein
MINALTGNTAPVTYTLRTKDEATAGIDTDRNGIIDDHDCYMTLRTSQGDELLDINDLRQALKSAGADQQPVDDQVVINQLKRQYNDPSLEELGIVTGSFNFDFLSTYRHKQSFQLQGEEISYTLQFDPNAPLRSWDPQEQGGEAVLVRDQDGVLRWELPEAPEAPPLPEGAVTEVTQVRRDGVLHWLWPGDVPQAGDEIVGTAAELEKQLGL